MSQRYKVRLSDGTSFSVDRDGLREWLKDEGAMVQAPGLQQWRPLRVLVTAVERSTRAAVPVVPSPARPGAASAPAIGEPNEFVSLADQVRPWGEDPVGPAPARLEDLPVIPFKPQDPDERRPAPILYEPASAPPDPYEHGDRFDEWYRGDARDEKLFRAFALMGNLLSPWLHRLDRVLRRLPPPVEMFAWTRRLGPPLRRVADSARDLAATGAAAARKTWEEARTARTRVSPEAVAEPLAPVPAPSPRRGVPEADEPVPAPLPIAQVPVLRLAEVPEVEEEGTLYDGPDRWQAGWAWLKRVVVLSGLTASAVLIFMTRESWLPEAEFVARALFTEVDTQARSRERAEQRDWAARQAREQMPHLAPATVQLVLSADAARSLDIAELFRFTSDVVDRGKAALPAGEERELRDLRGELLESLSPEDRERVRAYDQARAYRATLPFEDREALSTFARGARALPPRSRARLQALTGEAISAGLRTMPPSDRTLGPPQAARVSSSID